MFGFIALLLTKNNEYEQAKAIVALPKFSRLSTNSSFADESMKSLSRFDMTNALLRATQSISFGWTCLCFRRPQCKITETL